MNDPSTDALIETLTRAGAFAKLAQEFYEAANWTPTYYGATTAGVTTYTAQDGHYVRIGSVVHVWGVVGWSAATGTGNARVSLPLTVASHLTGVAVTLRLNGVTYAGDSFQGLSNGGTAYFEIAGIASTGGPTVSAVEAGGSIVFSLSYPVE